ncbi:MAG TPA: TIGR02757 family protein [Spirochaetia bacterium]|nr:TIGR02757 family protein [Spirochaetia bacterium]
MTTSTLTAQLGDLYKRYNRREFVHPDPLEMVYRYSTPEDQEIAGLISASLAYGRVSQILQSVGSVLDMMDSGSSRRSPHGFLGSTTDREIRSALRRFKHRFTPGEEVAALLIAIKRMIAEHGSLEVMFAVGLGRDDETVLPALEKFVDQLRAAAGGPGACPSLLSSPADGSACKRLNLYLRWMVRKDVVDPGPWSRVPRSKLVVPLDTHMFRISRALGLTSRRQANLRTALEITRSFARHSPKDPVRYDFCLTRLGINPSVKGSPLLHPLQQYLAVIERE